MEPEAGVPVLQRDIPCVFCNILKNRLNLVSDLCGLLRFDIGFRHFALSFL
jgi:hypothetical protein